MLFSAFSIYLAKLEDTASRNEMTGILADLLEKAGQEEIDKICYLLLGELLPSYRGVEFNIAEKLMIQILAAAFGKEPREIAKLYKSKGDLGDVAAVLAANSKFIIPRPRRGEAEGGQNSKLSVAAVYEKMLEIAKESGEGSQERKIKKMAELITGLEARSAKYVARIPVGKLRLGFSEATILDALSFMAAGNKSARPAIEQAYNVTADIGLIAERIKKGGLAALEKIEAKPGIPLRFSLAERLSGAAEAIEKAGPEVGVERKLDGFRTQIHIWREGRQRRAALFSRNQENTTAMFPEIAASAAKLKVESAILDGEAIGYNPKTGKFLPFQETVQRKRKYGIEEYAKKIPLSVFVFDILYINGRPLLNLPFRQRRGILEAALSRGGHEGAIRLASDLKTPDPAVIEKELKESISSGLEGLVVKNLASPYEAGKRGFHWIKLKATSAALERLRGAAPKAKAALPDTVDCLVMGAWRGRGKRTEFGVGGFLLGVRGSDDRYYTISRLGTGLSDEQFREANSRLKKLKVEEPPKDYVVDKDVAPDIWARPALVVEILADEVTLSPRHTAGRKEGGRGYSLRFPRLVRFRDDKNPEDATTVKEVAEMHKKQR